MTFTVNRVEGLGYVDKSHAEILVLFAALFLNLGCSEDHVYNGQLGNRIDSRAELPRCAGRVTIVG